ncbi:copper fist DNA binding domain-domain-containing protein [Syncephalastrum racemosum]|uniref:Copper fist DNA binding domain-domain-containing protein n=1 Tax=Syncephalastrum racemosum TaxID=13706 RepID=A0A1X2H9W7_SYNRA|nr:copper fist DNA binding domain-domain-containing protein [Syncephalastrum racemosum]
MAIVKDGIKYACAACIRGHRVQKCQHFDRELIPLQKRGRQISQCQHCRTLRSTHRSHVKCTCAAEPAPNPITGCFCEVVHTCSCVAGHLQDTSTHQQQQRAILRPTPDDNDQERQALVNLLLSNADPKF